MEEWAGQAMGRAVPDLDLVWAAEVVRAEAERAAREVEAVAPAVLVAVVDRDCGIRVGPAVAVEAPAQVQVQVRAAPEEEVVQEAGRPEGEELEVVVRVEAGDLEVVAQVEAKEPAVVEEWVSELPAEVVVVVAEGLGLEPEPAAAGEAKEPRHLENG